MIISNINPKFNPQWIELLRLDPVHPIDDNKTLIRRLGSDRLIYVMIADNNPAAFLQVALTNSPFLYLTGNSEETNSSLIKSKYLLICVLIHYILFLETRKISFTSIT